MRAMAKTTPLGAASRPRKGARVVQATEAAKNFGRLVNAVREEQAVYVVERGGVPVAEIGPAARPPFRVSDFVALIRSLPGPDGAYARAVSSSVARLNKPTVPRNPWAR